MSWKTANATLLLILLLAIAWGLPHPLLEESIIWLGSLGMPSSQLVYILWGFPASLLIIQQYQKIPRVLWRVFIIFIIASALLVIFAPNSSTALKTAIGFILKGWIPAMLAALVANESQERRLILKSLLIGALAVAVVGIWEFVSGHRIHTGVYYVPLRVGSTIGHYVPMASVLFIGLGMSLALRSTWPKLHRITGPALLLLWTITMARAAAACMVLLGMTVAIGDRNARRSVIHISLAFLMSLLIVGSALAAHPSTSSYLKHWRESAMERFNSSLADSVKPSSPRRMALLTSIRMLRAKPWLGIGYGAYAKHYDEYRVAGGLRDIKSPDNVYVRFLCETGLLVSLLAFIGLGWGFLSVWQRLQIEMNPDLYSERFALLCTICGLCLQGLSYDIFYWNALLIPFSMILSFAACAWEDCVVHD